MQDGKRVGRVNARSGMLRWSLAMVVACIAGTTSLVAQAQLPPLVNGQPTYCLTPGSEGVCMVGGTWATANGVFSVTGNPRIRFAGGLEFALAPGTAGLSVETTPETASVNATAGLGYAGAGPLAGVGIQAGSVTLRFRRGRNLTGQSSFQLGSSTVNVRSDVIYFYAAFDGTAQVQMPGMSAAIPLPLPTAGLSSAFLVGFVVRLSSNGDLSIAGQRLASGNLGVVLRPTSAAGRVRGYVTLSGHRFELDQSFTTPPVDRIETGDLDVSQRISLDRVGTDAIGASAQITLNAGAHAFLSGSNWGVRLNGGVDYEVSTWGPAGRDSSALPLHEVVRVERRLGRPRARLASGARGVHDPVGPHPRVGGTVALRSGAEGCTRHETHRAKLVALRFSFSLRCSARGAVRRRAPTLRRGSAQRMRRMFTLEARMLPRRPRIRPASG